MGVVLLIYGRKAESEDVREVVRFCRENGIEVIDARGIEND